VVVAAWPEVVLRSRIELADPSGRVRRNVYQRARTLEPAAAAVQVEAARKVAAEQASAALRQTLRQAADEGAAVRSCAVVVGAFSGAPLESILASHALAHAAEGRLYQEALLQGAESCGLEAVAVPKRSIVPREGIDELRRELGPPWAEDQKLAALAAWIALERAG
jgi:hypothetical protein